MARTTWHPYAPDQAFGHQAAADEALLDQALAELEQHRRYPPRAGSKAQPRVDSSVRPPITGWVGSGAGLPVTTNIALEAAACLRAEVDPAV